MSCSDVELENTNMATHPPAHVASARNKYLVIGVTSLIQAQKETTISRLFKRLGVQSCQTLDCDGRRN